ncbi:MAG: methyl-accepting chemotaxis protein [Haloarculaceae archaeon]
MTADRGGDGSPGDAAPTGGDERADRAADAPAESDALAAEGLEAARDTEATIEELAVAASELRANVGELDRMSDRIADVVDLITDIAEQTNILALNASIEAARADTDSEGFAVVAREIKQLAEQAHEHTDEIEAAVETIDANTDGAVENLEAVNERISAGMGTSQRTVTALEKLDTRRESPNETHRAEE